ncbi:uncharacterized protein LOC126655802 [Mercurialis annua]|uniref:uncharacterized protein LOC126655802 n=1 Tax=Mercurialis annua TaxID=3986 RepID=UPI0021608BF5|nr:uncharacterized protein LOC126655802 [Mercurialis annua]XP_050206066.1 uncharacterized protein LOC126655802 [Mercurialis annua]XP_050206067.1 uncharacterized protein LOC126655802 [Mercurialis annua]XP_050206069.1 uncharacterized protein LOC126655802 [Mercurialis annua]
MHHNRKRRRSNSAATKMRSCKTLILTPSRLKDLLLALSALIILHLLFHSPPRASFTRSTTSPASPLNRRHLLFSVASSSSSFSPRAPYLRLWYNSKTTRAFAFLDANVSFVDPTLPPVIISKDTSRFPYTFKGGLRSAIRVARVVKEAVDMNLEEVRWLVFGDDDTVFFVENLVRTLSFYDHEQWYYIGSNSESYEQNLKNSFDMGFGGGGFVISYSLGKVVARVLDLCLIRYAHLYGSDARVFSCLAELGVGLTHEPGFHQVDMRGNLFGMLSAHPLSPLLSLHHLDAADPIFPEMTKIQAVKHLFKAANVDPNRILQQTVCYDRKHLLTVKVAWGYSIQVFEGDEYLQDLLSLQKTFRPWRRGSNIEYSRFMFNTRDYPRDLCKRPPVFFMESVASVSNGVLSNYTRYSIGNCPTAKAIKNLDYIKVFAQNVQPDGEQMKVPRRQCCDISPTFNESMIINIRKCGVDELISMRY